MDNQYIKDQMEEAAKDEHHRCMKLIDDLRISEAGDFKSPKCQGQRGQDRSDALYDAYRLLEKTPPAAAR